MSNFETAGLLLERKLRSHRLQNIDVIRWAEISFRDKGVNCDDWKICLNECPVREGRR